MKEKDFFDKRTRSALAIFGLIVCIGTAEVSAGGSQGQGAASTTSVTGQSIVRVGISGDPGTLNPFAPRSNGGISVNRSIYEFLIDRDVFGGPMVGSLMKSWEQKDELTYNLTVYDYIRDTAGNPLTASDVKFSYDTAKALGNLPKLSIIDAITVVDRYTASFKFKDPLAVGDLEAIWSEMPVVTEAAYKASPDNMATTPVGTTAYRVTEFVPGSRLVLKETGNYWQTDTSKMPLAAKANVDTIEFHIIREAAQMVIALETGNIDVTNSILNSRQISRFIPGGELSQSFSSFRYMNNPTQNLLFNCDGSKLFSTNKALRQAVAYAIDTKGLAEGVYGNFGVALKTFGSSKYSDYNKAWDNEPYYEYDLARAKTLLAQAGYPNGGLNLNLLVENGEEFQNMAVIIQGYLVEAGITVRISSYEKAMLNNLFSDPNSFDMILYGYASTDYLVNLWKLPLLASSYNGHTQNFVVDNAMQRLLEQSITPQGHTQANVNTLHNYLKDNMYIYGLVTNYGYVLGNKRINDVVLDSRNMIIPGACSYDFSR